MTIRKKLGGAAMGLAAVLVLGGVPLIAQEPAEKQQETNHRVPANFGKVALTGEQRSRIYAIQARRKEKIDALEKQIADEKAALLVECEGVLTDTQKKLLENLRQAAASPKPAAPPAPTKPSGSPKSS
jgi:hypothetical protein